MTHRSSSQPQVHETRDAVLIACPYDHHDAKSLLQAFHREQVQRYGYAEPLEADPTEYQDPQGGFFVAYRNRSPVGCGGFHWYDRIRAIAELKRLYVVTEMRGHGIGRLLLTAMEAAAIQRGARQIILESGVHNLAALDLIHRAGYKRIPRYVDSRDPKINRAFAKTLGGELDLPSHGPEHTSM